MQENIFASPCQSIEKGAAMQLLLELQFPKGAYKG